MITHKELYKRMEDELSDDPMNVVAEFLIFIKDNNYNPYTLDVHDYLQPGEECECGQKEDEP